MTTFENTVDTTTPTARAVDALDRIDETQS